MKRVARSSLLALALIAVAWAAYRPFLDLALLGWDTYPLILASQIGSLGDFIGTFGEELMAGRFPEGHFYRPVAHLVIAFDHARYGLDPFGYHLTNLAILVTTAFLVAGVTRRVLGADLAVGGALAAFLFCLHPVLIEILPFPPRRADALALLGTVACLAILPRQDSAHRRLAGGASALFALLAMGAKESGVIVVPLVLMLHFLEGPNGFRDRAVHSLRKATPVLAAGLVYSVARTFVLGGLGGYPESSATGGVSLPELVRHYSTRLLYPQPFLENASLALSATAVCAVALIVSCVLVARRPGTREAAACSRIRVGLIFLGFWFVCVFAVSGVAGRVQDWYALPMLAPYAILLGVLIDRGIARGRAGRRLEAAGLLAVPFVLALTHVAFSPLFHHYAGWESASKIARETLDDLHAELEKAEAGDEVVVRGFVDHWRRAPGRPGVRRIAILAGYSVQAWVELRHPELPVVVRYPGVSPAAPEDAVIVTLVFGPRPARD